MHPKPKSAPARMKSKFTTNKSNAMKEMEAWAKRDADTHEASRMSGQLSDNVTEERMLRSKLWELSKERHKFLLQNAYEKKIFMDKMSKKANPVRRYSAHESFTRRLSLEAPNSCSDSRSDVGSISVKSAPQTKLHPNARLALLERMDPRNGRDRPKEVQKSSSSSEKGRVVTFRPQLVTEMGNNAMRGDPRHFPRQQTFTEDIKTVPGEISGQFQQSQTPSKVSRPWRTVATMSEVSRAFSTVIREGDDESSFTSWAKKKNDKGYKSGSMIRDPRYSHLEHALCPIKSNGMQTDLKTVVENLESLHLPPRTPKEAKPKIELKAMEFMKERGIVF